MYRNIKQSKFYGEIPDEFNSSMQLMTMYATQASYRVYSYHSDLSYTDIEGVVPPSIAELPSLITLYIIFSTSNARPIYSETDAQTQRLHPRHVTLIL